MNDYADCEEHDPECMSSEEMRGAFEEFNEYNSEIREGCKVVSMDVKALYPSMTWKAIVQAVKEMIKNSDLVIDDVDWLEVAKYIAVMVPKEEIEAERLERVIPKRKNIRTKRITINYLRNKKNDDKWTLVRKPGRIQKKKMLALAISVGIHVAMSCPVIPTRLAMCTIYSRKMGQFSMS